MWNEPSPGDLDKLPPLYATEHVDWPEKIIREHFFLGGCDWFMVEYDAADRIFFGFAILHRDLANAEWGYVNLNELCTVNVGGIEVDRDLHWKPRRADQVELIREAHGAPGDDPGRCDHAPSLPVDGASPR